MVTFGKKQLCSSCFSPIKKEPCKCCGFSRENCVQGNMTLPVGSILMGNFLIGRVLGKGGFGITYQAYDVKLNRIIAVKEYFPVELALREKNETTLSARSKSSSELFGTGVKKFYNEAAVLAEFPDNPNIVKIYQLFYENNTAYFTMEYVSGMTLKDYVISCGTINSEQAMYIALGMANALREVHSKHILHRDVSPDNIMLCHDGSVKLLDFGAARQVFPEGSQLLSVILKPGFAPLEQYMRKGRQGEYTDLYSLAASLFYAVTKQIPEDPQNRFEDDSAMQNNIYGLQPDLWEVIRKTMSVKYTDRFQTTEEFINALGSVPIKPRAVKLPKTKLPVNTDSSIQKLIDRLFGSI